MRLWFKKRAADTLPSRTPEAQAAGVPGLKPHELTMERGDACLKLGEFDEAARCYRAVLEREPLHPGALINLGFATKELRRFPESVEYIERALQVAPDDADAHYLRALLYQGGGDLTRAISHLERAVTIRPKFEFAYRELVVALFKTGRVDAAARWCDRALELNPDSPELRFYRSNLHKQANETDAAIASARAALRLRPGLFAARSSLNDLLLRASRDNSRMDSPQSETLAAGFNELGISYLLYSEFPGARAAFENALALAPQVAEYHYNLGSLLSVQQDMEGAAASFAKAIAIEPDYARARWGKSLMYASPFPESPSAAERDRTAIMAGLHEFSRWSCGRAVRGEQFVGFNAPFYLTYQELDNRPVFELYGSLCVQAMKPLASDLRVAPPIAAPPGPVPIRVGIVSPDIREHSVWFSLIKGWLEHFDRGRFEIGIFSLSSTVDRETEWAKQRADFFTGGPKSVRQWAESISALSPAILIYPAIGLDILTLQLASLRLAPLQVNTWGHPETSGLPTIDMYLSGQDFEPPDAQRFYSEKLVPLLNLGNCYQGRVERVVEADLDALGIDPSRPILICSGTAFKFQVEHDDVLARVAGRIDGSQLILFRQRPESLSDLLMSRLEHAFSRAGLDFERHVRFLAAQPLPIFHGLLRRADVALDTVGFSGYNTAIQAIESGVPVVTREGRFLRGRLASGILRQLGLTELITETTEEYVDLAVKLAGDSELQGKIRSEIGRRRAVIYNDIASIRHMEDVLEAHIRG